MLGESEPQISQDTAVAIDTADASPWRKVILYIKVFGLIVLAAFLIYTGRVTSALICLVIAAVVALRMFAAEKTAGVITVGLQRIGVRLPTRQNAGEVDMAKVMADVQQQKATPVTPPTATGDEVGAKPETSKRGFKMSLPALLGRVKTLGKAQKAKPATAAVKPARDMAALQTAPLGSLEDADHPTGLMAKMQLFFANLVPAERELKALADRPDPFERLAAEARRTTAS